MRGAREFVDSNVLLYLLSGEPARADAAERVLERAPLLSVQVLNEVVHVALRKFRMPLAEVRAFSRSVRALCEVAPLTPVTHEGALDCVDRYRLSFYDALIVSAAINGGCRTLWSEDFQEGQVFGGALKVRNPFGSGLGGVTAPRR